MSIICKALWISYEDNLPTFLLPVISQSSVESGDMNIASVSVPTGYLTLGQVSSCICASVSLTLKRGVVQEDGQDGPTQP